MNATKGPELPGEANEPPKFIIDGVNYVLDEVRSTMMSELKKMDVEDQMRALANIVDISEKIRREIKNPKSVVSATSVSAPEAVSVAAPVEKAKKTSDVKTENESIDRIIADLQKPEVAQVAIFNVIQMLASRQGLSQKQIADLSGTNQSYISQLITGKTHCNTKTGARLIKWAISELNKYKK